jgi:hypothetical protein
MKVYLLHNREFEYPIVFDENTSKPDPLLLRFAICKHQFPGLINKRLRKCNKKTVTDAIQRICYLINRLAEQIQTDGSSGIHYMAATYRDNMEPLISSMYFHGGWRGESIEQYVKAWRQFYRFITLQGIDHEMMMPETNEVTYSQDQDENFLSHTSYRREKVGEQETAIEHHWKERHDDYKDKILSMDQFWLLYAGLNKIDSVYAVMAYTQLVTCLRVNALIENYPLSQNKLNPKWQSYLEMVRDGLTTQKLNYIAKGGRTKCLLVPVTLMEVFHNIYDQPEIGVTYNQRFKRYRDNYCNTLWAKKRGISQNLRPTWLLKNGTPVSTRGYQSAMKRVSGQFKFEAHPHALRHTGVTQMLYRYIKNNGLLTGLNHTNHLIIADAHIMLQQHLGHVGIETTRIYLKTIERIIHESQIDILLNTALSTSKKHHEMLEKNEALSKGIQLIEQVIGKVDDEQQSGNLK